MFMLQITKRSKEQYLDTLAACNYDKESSLLLLEFLSVTFSLLVIMLQTNSSLSFLPYIKLKLKEMGKVNNPGYF